MIAPSAVAVRPGPKPPYQAATITESVNITSGATSPRDDLSRSLAANTTAVDAIATKYCNNLEGVADIYFIIKSIPEIESGLSPPEIQDTSRTYALLFRMCAMSEIFSDALKENQCEGSMTAHAEAICFLYPRRLFSASFQYCRFA